MFVSRRLFCRSRVPSFFHREALGSEVTVPILGFPVDPLPWGVVTLTIMDPEGVDWDVGIPLEAGVVAVVARRGWTNIRYGVFVINDHKKTYGK